MEEINLKFELNEANKEKKALLTSVEANKKKFANELRSGLGRKITENPNQIRFVKKSIKDRLVIWLKNIFTKF